MKDINRIIVTRRWPEVVEKELCDMYGDIVQLNESDQAMSQDDLKQALCSADCVLPTVTDPFDAEVLSVDKIRCQFLGNFGVGYNHINLDAARAAGIVVTNTPEVLTDCTADIAMTLLLMVARRAGEGERHVRTHAWSGWRPTHMRGSKVSGKVLGLVGFGRIATAVAQRAHCGFGMKISFYDPGYNDDGKAEKFQATGYATMDELLAHSDFVSLHCPGGKKTYHLIDRQQLKTMKKSAFLINTARGDVVNSQALINALKNGQIAGAGLDVYEGEPAINDGFYDLENAVLLPHLGSASEETRVAMGQRVVANLKAWANGEPPKDRVV